MTDEDKRIQDEYLSLSESDREKYVEDNGVVVIEDDDGVHVVLNDMYSTYVQEYKDKNNIDSIDEAFSQVLQESMDLWQKNH